MLTADECAMIAVNHSMPEEVELEIVKPTEWRLGFSIPLDLLERYAGRLRALKGSQWRANFNKCGDETSRPHWATWAPVDELNFHKPECFGKIKFA
jgi:hypothetical protein